MNKNIPIAEFKAHCYSIIDKANESNTELIITRRNNPVARIVPINNRDKSSIVGFMQGRADIIGNIVESANILWNSETDE